MPFDKKDDNSYMDGVPVKISEKYKRRPTIRLPSSCQNCVPGPAIYEEYDFRLERSVISKLEDWKQAKEEQAQRREDRLKRLKCADDEAEQLKQLTIQQPTESEVNPSGASCLQSSILTPTNAITFAQPIPRSNPSSFKFSDFESDNSSPFDNMELKTINDMEVLASVLSSNTDPNSSTQVKPTSPPSVNNNFIPNGNGYVWDKWNGYNVYSSPQYYNHPPQYQNMYAAPTYNVDTSHCHAMWPSGGHLPVYPTTSLLPGAHRTEGVVPRFHSVDVDSREPHDDGRLTSQKSNSKSVPDLVLELQKELKEKARWDEQRRKTQTPPPRPSALNTGLEDWKPWPDLESPRHSGLDLESCSPSGQDALETLSPSRQSLARSIREMGFPLARIVRTIKKFGGDDKKVIEFLIQVHRLEEKKFVGDLVEKALHANNYDESESVKHLEATVVLLDLGFDPEKVQQTLLECKNDRDLALERLIS